MNAQTFTAAAAVRLGICELIQDMACLDLDDVTNDRIYENARVWVESAQYIRKTIQLRNLTIKVTQVITEPPR